MFSSLKDEGGVMECWSVGVDGIGDGRALQGGVILDNGWFWREVAKRASGNGKWKSGGGDTRCRVFFEERPGPG